MACGCKQKSVVDREKLVQRQTKAREDARKKAARKGRQLAARSARSRT